MRIVIKIGTSTLTHRTGMLNIQRVEDLCKVMSDLKNAGNEIILVSSGAIGLGVAKLSLSERPVDIPGKQAAAAVGQCELMYIYDRLFTSYHHNIAQLLITKDDVENTHRKRNFQNTLFRLLELRALPIINENDTIATEEIVFGDNDNLAAVVAKSVEADLLIILSDINGLYTSDPNLNPDAIFVHEVEEISNEILGMTSSSAGTLGTGGMITKIHAAQIVTEAGIDMVISNGKNPSDLYAIIDGKPIGTRFKGRKI